MKKSTLLMVLSLVLALTVGLGTTLAYLTDTDADVNVMTLGNVDIEQIEQERDENGELQDFTQAKPLYPAVYPGNQPTDSIPFDDPENWAVANDPAWKTVQENENVVDKFVTVENTGKSDAYVRTIIAYEGDPISGDDIHIIQNAIDSSAPEVKGEFAATEYIKNVVIDGVRYDLIVYTYKDALAPGETTIPSLKQIYMDHTCTNDSVEKYGETYDILVVSQAVQAAGFEDAQTALNEAFGEITADNNPWKKDGQDIDGTPVFPVMVSTADEFIDAMANGGEVILTDDIDLGDARVTVTKDTTIQLNGSVLSGVCNDGQDHMFMVNNGATLNIKDGSADNSGKITYALNNSDIGWAIDLEGCLNLYSGTIELTGSPWYIGYAVDVRPNAWGNAYTEGTVFHMYGGKIVSSDGAVRVASSSSETYDKVSASFIMDAGEIVADWDGIFVQQSNAKYDILNVEVNGGTITSTGLSPIRVYGPEATDVVGNVAKPMTLVVDSDAKLLLGEGVDTSTRTWYLQDKVALGGGMTKDILDQYATIQIAQ